MTKKTFTADTSNQRLDKYVAQRCPERSRSQLKAYILNGNVLVDGKVQRPSYRLNEGDTIQLDLPDPKPEIDHIEPQEIPLEIMHEDDQLIIINKPAGLVVHPGVGVPNGTLVNGLVYYCNQLSDVNGPVRPGIVHRLDRDTSGVMVVAKTNQAHFYLADQFQSHTVEKVYEGITWGIWDEPQGMIEAPIGRNRRDPTAYCVSEDGKPSETGYQVQQNWTYLSRVQFYPRTGRTHQIRVHSTYRNRPIFADEKYGGGHNRIRGYTPEVSKILESMINLLQRHALHAHTLAINHPDTGARHTFTAPLPEDMAKLTRELSATHFV